MSAGAIPARGREPSVGDGAPSLRARRWVGVDLSGAGDGRPARRLLPLLVFALVAALGVAALRIDLIRTRYAMASVLAEENALIEEQRGLIVRRRQLRDPVELAVQARARGFRPLATMRTLPDPPVPGPGIATRAETRPAATAPSTAAAPAEADPAAARTAGTDWR